MKKITRLDLIQSMRRTWEINPSTRVRKNKKAYNRKPKHKGAIHV